MKPYHTIDPTLPSLTFDAHRRAFDLALRQAVGTSQPALRLQALREASAHLIHPRLILESPLLADHHPWKHEALAVSDAFEAVTNGMEEPGVLDALEDLAPDSPFQPWRHLVLAVHFFYEGLDEAVEAHCSRIPAGSPVAALGSLLSSLAAENPTRRREAALERLAALVAQPDPGLQQTLQDLAEGLENDHEDLFWNALADWLETVVPRDAAQAQAAVLWAWNQLEWRDFDEAVLLDLGSGHWGAAESYRLAALGTLPWDPEGAALLWFRFMVCAVRAGDLEDTESREAWDLLGLFRQAAAEAGSASAEWTDTWDNLSRAWNHEARARGWEDRILGVNPVPALPVLPERPSPDGQLDLFAR